MQNSLSAYANREDILNTNSNNSSLCSFEGLASFRLRYRVQASPEQSLESLISNWPLVLFGEIGVELTF